MEGKSDKEVNRENDSEPLFESQSNMVNLNNRNLNAFSEYGLIPLSLTELYVSRNNLIEVPTILLTLKNIKVLDISHNKIEYFDDTPRFCLQIEHLNLSHNNLKGPPYWIWTESPKKLMYLDLSYNMNISHSFHDGYFEELLQYECLVPHIKINNCILNNYMELFGTFSKALELDIGTEDLTSLKTANFIPEVPYMALEKCCELIRLNLCNTGVFFINGKVNIFTNLKEVNLAHNRLSSLPNEFCHLQNLQICLLSFNSLMYLPDEFDKLKKLKVLCLDGNEMCMLPDITSFPQLTVLDLYDNKLYDVPDGVDKMFEIDLAQNFFDEPTEEEYTMKKKELRTHKNDRVDGRKEDIGRPYSSRSSYTSENDISNSDEEHYVSEEINRDLESSEDWDSDDYWVPHFNRSSGISQSPWLSFVHKKMAEGNFCPMDSHAVSIAEMVKYEKLCYPQENGEVDGQFDDYSGDESG